MASLLSIVVVLLVATTTPLIKVSSWSPNYGEALYKSLLFFEGQRSGKLPPNQRVTWRKDSGLFDGHEKGLDLTGGYYDAGDNVKFNFPMAFTTTLIAWSVIEFGKDMGPELEHALEAIRWSTDYFLKCTNTPGVVYVQVGNPYSDHSCWQRPENMDTDRTAYAVTTKAPGSEVSAEIAAALASSSIVFRSSDPNYSRWLLDRAKNVFDFADRYQGSFNNSEIGHWVCPFYCDFSGYKDELIWGAAWLHKATNSKYYWDYVLNNIHYVENPDGGGLYSAFNWDLKSAGINVLISKVIFDNKLKDNLFIKWADRFVCDLLPGSPTPTVQYSPGGIFCDLNGWCDMQSVTPLSFLTVVYAGYLENIKRAIQCENNRVLTPPMLINFARGQVDYLLGKNPMGMSYMVGYGEKYPRRIHHRGSSLPSVDQHPKWMNCTEGFPYIYSEKPNPNVLTGAVVGGPNMKDEYIDDRNNTGHTEPTTYIVAPLVGLLGYFQAH